MKIEFEFDKSYQISLIHKIPEFNRLKLLGYNGIGKSITANILATISGEPVWTGADSIKNLANYLPSFSVKIKLNDDVYRIESKINDWEIDEISGKLKPESIGKFFLNETKTNFDQFQNDFKCYVIKGNEDINTQIEKLALKIKRMILFNINNLRKLFSEFQKEIDFIQTHLTQGTLYTTLLNDDELIHKINLKKNNNLPIENLEGLISGIKTIKNKDWFSLKSPNESLAGLIIFKEKINKELGKNKIKIDDLHKKIPQKYVQKINEYSIMLKNLNEEKEKLIFPLDKNIYSDEPTTRKGKIEIINKINEKEKSEKLFIEDNFRKEYWSNAVSDLKFELEDKKLDSSVEVLLKSRNRNSISVKELILWQQESNITSQQMLKKLGNYETIKNEIEELKQKATQFDEHILNLEKWNKFNYSIEDIKTKLTKYIADLKDIEELPEIEIKYRELEAEFNGVGFIESHLKELIKFKSWHEVLEEYEPPKDIDGFIKNLSDKIDDLKDISKSINRYEKNKKRYIENLEKTEIIQKLPKVICKLIDERKVISLCKIALFLSEKNLQSSILDFLEEDCKVTVDNFIKNQDTEQSKQALFISRMNEYLGIKITNLLNMDAFQEHVFGNCKVITVNPQENILEYKDEDDNINKKYIADYSTGQKAFAFSMASIINAKSSSSAKNTLLILDEFGALLAEDKERFLIDSLNELQKKDKWPTKYIIVLPYKGEFDRTEYAERLGKEITNLKNDLKVRGYAFERLL